MRGDRVLNALEHIGSAYRGYCTVLDNASPDDAAGRVAQRFPEVGTIKFAANLGFAPAINIGIARSRAGVVVATNDDVLCSETALRRLVEPFADPGVGMVGGVLVNAGTGRIDTAGLTCDPSLAARDLLRGDDPQTVNADRILELAVGPSAGLAAYRRSALEEVGGFDNGFFAYYEDLDLALRMRRAGWKFGIAPDARAMHLGSASSGWRSRRKVELVGRSRGRILAKYGVLNQWRAVPWLGLELLACIGLTAELRNTQAFRSRWRGYWECRSAEPYPEAWLLSNASLRGSVRDRWARRYGRDK